MIPKNVYTLYTCAIDVDECASMMPCDENAECTNLEGSFSCVCNPGYIGNGVTCEPFSKPVYSGICIPVINSLYFMQMMTVVQRFVIIAL